MRTILLFFCIALVSGCNVSEKIQAWYNAHCPDSKITKLENNKFKVSIKCVNLYETAEVKKYLAEGKLTYDVREAELTIVGVSEDSILDYYKVLKAIQRGVKK